MQPIHPVLCVEIREVNEQRQLEDKNEQDDLKVALIPFLQLHDIAAIVLRFLRNPVTALYFTPKEKVESSRSIELDQWDRTQPTCLLVSSRNDQLLYGNSNTVETPKTVVDLRTFRQIPVSNKVPLFERCSLHDGHLYHTSGERLSRIRLQDAVVQLEIPLASLANSISCQRYDAFHDLLYIANREGDIWIARDQTVRQFSTGIKEINFCTQLNQTTLFIAADPTSSTPSSLTLWNTESKSATHRVVTDTQNARFHSPIIFPKRNKCYVAIGVPPLTILGGIHIVSTNNLHYFGRYVDLEFPLTPQNVSFCQAGEYDFCLAGRNAIEFCNLDYNTSIFCTLHCKNSKSSLYHARPPIFFGDQLFVFIDAKPTITVHQFDLGSLPLVGTSSSSSSSSGGAKK